MHVRGQKDIFASKSFTNFTNGPYTLERQIIDIDITSAEGQEFYVGLHKCDCTVYIYKIWFD